MVVLLWLGGCRLADDGVLSCKRDSDAYVGKDFRRRPKGLRG